ncbi:MAG: glycosyl transferase [Terriglobia bacterium]|nr:MAG: glycosyl transferase [Terriglobia bacterium]
MATHVFTSIVSNYIPKARVLARGLKRFHPEFCFHLVLSDAIPEWLDLGDDFDSIITIADLGLENPEQWVFKHSLVEVGTGVKGFVLSNLLERANCSEVLYFDPDIIILAPLRGLLEAFQHASILLTPHLTEPENSLEGILDNEICALQHGVYNLGFLGVKNSPEGRRFAKWWADRLRDFCYDDIPNGLFTDQRWIDMVPAYFDDIRILRDSVYNVCTWNLNHRRVDGNLRDGISVNGRPVVFYHFSGLDSGAQEGMLKKYGGEMPALFELREWYLQECDRMGQATTSQIPWAYGCFDNGVPVTPVHRRRYRERIDLQNAFPNPYCTSDINHSYYHWFEANEQPKQSVVVAGA